MSPVIFLFQVRYFEHVFGAARFFGDQFFFVLGEFRDSFNFRSQFLKFGVMDNYSIGFQSIVFNLMANATYIRTAEWFDIGKMLFFSENFLKIC